MRIKEKEKKQNPSRTGWTDPAARPSFLPLSLYGTRAPLQAPRRLPRTARTAVPPRVPLSRNGRPSLFPFPHTLSTLSAPLMVVMASAATPFSPLAPSHLPPPLYKSRMSLSPSPAEPTLSLISLSRARRALAGAVPCHPSHAQSSRLHPHHPWRPRPRPRQAPAIPTALVPILAAPHLASVRSSQGLKTTRIFLLIFKITFWIISWIL
jgi:hypothetical protein